MVRAVSAADVAKGPARAFAVSPPGIRAATSRSSSSATPARGTPRSTACGRPTSRWSGPGGVKFVVLSSDVVYPTGSMRHYEAKFWLPFMGTAKPVYAIPGNHDWYDALEGFAATFLEPDAARAAMSRRVEVDNRITSTTDRRIEELIATASRLQAGVRRADAAPGGALLPVPDRLVRPLRRGHGGRPARGPGADGPGSPARWSRPAARRRWRSSGTRSTPAGMYLGQGDAEFAALHPLLREHDVSIVMAGDTHDLEYYAERPAGSSRTVHHFVNGGGGAYLSFGTALAWPARPATADWAFYPSTAAGRRQDRGDDAGLEVARLVVDEAHRGLALLGRVALGRLRRQRGAVLPELHRGPRRALEGTRPPPALRRPRPAALGRHGGIARARLPTPGRIRRWNGSWRCPGRDEPVPVVLRASGPDDTDAPTGVPLALRWRRLV